jgi:hypothetical protein
MNRLPFARLRTRRTLMTVAGAVVAALVLWRLRPSEPLAEPKPDLDARPDPGQSPRN